MNVKIGAEAALFPEKEYISGIFVAVYKTRWQTTCTRNPVTTYKQKWLAASEE